MKNDWSYRTWGVCRTILGIGMVIGFFLPWLGSCNPQNGFDLLLNSPTTYHGNSDSITTFPDLSDKIELFLILMIGIVIFGLGALTAAGLFRRTYGISIWASLISSYFGIKILSILITLKYRDALYDSITVGLPSVLLCSISIMLFSIGEYFSNSTNLSDTS